MVTYHYLIDEEPFYYSTEDKRVVLEYIIFVIISSYIFFSVRSLFESKPSTVNITQKQFSSLMSAVINGIIVPLVRIIHR